MKKIETSNRELLQVLTDNGINIICDNDMQMTISDEDASKIDDIVIDCEDCDEYYIDSVGVEDISSIANYLVENNYIN